MDYATLTAELANDPLNRGYAAMTDAEAADALNAKDRTRVVMRFGSFRTLASLLTSEEYATVRTTLDTAAQSSVMIADAIAYLKLPGSEDGSGGGINFGDPVVRGMVDSLFSTPIAAKIKGYAEEAISRAEELGCPDVTDHYVSRCRGGN